MDSTFRLPLVLKPLPMQIEVLLFKDILEEKTAALQNILTEFLKVQPHQKFNAEFSKFLKRTKRIIQEGHRNGSNISRIIRSSSSLYIPQTNMSVIGSNSRRAFKVPEPNVQSNNLPQNRKGNMQPIMQLSHNDNTCSTSSFQPHVLCPTINEKVQEESLPSTSVTLTNSTNNQSTHVSVQNIPPKRNFYPDVPVIENKLEGSQKDDYSNSIECLLDNVGFKNICRKTDESNMSKNSDKPTCLGNGEKYLSKWSVNMKRIKSVYKTKVLLAITGSLLSDNQITIEERFHDAGFLEGRMENNLIKTTNGIYNLIGNIIGGSPNELYHVFLEVGGIPRTWRHIVNELTKNKSDNKTATLNFALESLASPSMARQNEVKSNLDKKPKNKVKRKCSEQDLIETNKSKQRKLTKKLPSLMTSTSLKTTKKDYNLSESPEKGLLKDLV
ncbi:Hypothetical protein CINCED_3A008637 [Cinara cedri]|uniref:Uncharacterized protein n=1 Tax=Cinara cedri TaxID=506608 RepID=A0A5E4MFI6_9HEMI|nr:Hypothetical protein CINCED_3A008637 [Cinara cedri]